MNPVVVERLKRDCSQHGYGRKKWWANQLGVPPLTLSHWLAGRQKPNGLNSIQISKILAQVEKENFGELWKESLWNTYYTAEPIPFQILPMVLLEILALPRLDSRTLALLSRFIERSHPPIPTPDTPELKNRVGWLLEVSGQKPPFAPDRTAGTQTILQIYPGSRWLKKYLRRYQTPWGKKWRIYDCPLEPLKASLP